MDTKVQYGENSYCSYWTSPLWAQDSQLGCVSVHSLGMRAVCFVGTGAQVMAGERCLRHTYGCNMKILVLPQKSLQAWERFKNWRFLSPLFLVWIKLSVIHQEKYIKFKEKKVFWNAKSKVGEPISRIQ